MISVLTCGRFLPRSQIRISGRRFTNTRKRSSIWTFSALETKDAITNAL
jgi:hypothetical protein